MLEKLLKALILIQGNRFERTHDLTRLAALSKTQDIDGLSEISETLNLFAVNGRYPGDLPEIDIHTLTNHYFPMSIIEELQRKAAELPENTAAEVLDFLEFVSTKARQRESTAQTAKPQSVRGAFRGRLSSSRQYAAAKKDEIAFEQ